MAPLPPPQFGPGGPGGPTVLDPNQPNIFGLTPAEAGISVLVADPRGVAAAPDLITTPPVKQSLNDVLHGFYFLAPDAMEDLQHKLFVGGFYPAGAKEDALNPYDDETFAAYKRAVIDSVRSGLSVSGVLDRAYQSGLGKSGASGTVEQPLSLNIRLADPAALRLVAEKAFQDAIGKKPTQGELDRFVSSFQGSQTAQQGTENAQQVANRSAYLQARQSANAPLPAGGDLGRFMGAIRQVESSGNYAWGSQYSGDPSVGNVHGAYQFSDSEWQASAAGAGVDPNDHSQVAQDRAASWHFQQAFVKYGNWSDVAIAHFGGPGGVAAAHKGTYYKDSSGLSTQGYAAKVLGLMGGQQGGGVNAGLPVATQVTTTEPNAQADAEMMARQSHPTEYAAYQLLNTYDTFLKMLGPGGGQMPEAALPTAINTVPAA